MPSDERVVRRIWWLTVSKAADRSSRMRTDDLVSAFAIPMASVTESSTVSVQCPRLNPWDWIKRACCRMAGEEKFGYFCLSEGTECQEGSFSKFITFVFLHFSCCDWHTHHFLCCLSQGFGGHQANGQTLARAVLLSYASHSAESLQRHGSSAISDSRHDPTVWTQHTGTRKSRQHVYHRMLKFILGSCSCMKGCRIEPQWKSSPREDPCNACAVI